MISEIRTFPRENGEHQRVHIVRLSDWDQLELLRPTPTADALECFYQLYRLYLVPSAPQLFGSLVLFSLPADLPVPFPAYSDNCGHLADPLSIAAAALRSGVTVRPDGITFQDSRIQVFWEALVARDCIRLVHGERSTTTILPVGAECGYLTEVCPDAALKVNSSFFIMDPIDCGTPYDHIGAWFGLFAKNGVVENPPLFGREALTVSCDGTVSVEQPDIRTLSVHIGGRTYRHGENARFYTRPEHTFSPEGKQALVITGTRLAAVCAGAAQIPCSGFVICPDAPAQLVPGIPVRYGGMEHIRFAIQVGNSILRDGIKTAYFCSSFYNVQQPQATPYPPSLYPLDFHRARAARIALGADAQGKPVLLWAEGAAKLGHVPGADSCGASLSEMADICQAVGMHNAVNLDGGGSAQLLLHNTRSLCLTDRSQTDYCQAERPVPIALMIR